MKIKKQFSCPRRASLGQAISNFKFLAGLAIAILAVGFFVFRNNANEAVASWWNDSWLYRKALTINQTKVAGALTDFPMLVSLTDSGFVGKTQDDGGDFVFTLEDGTVLAHEIESFASSTGALVAWVKMPSLSSSQPADIFMYYGNASATDQEEPSKVWDENFVGVWHFPHDTNASTSDSTAYANNGVTGGNASSTSSGKVGGAFQFDGVNDYVDVGSKESLDNLSTITFCAWVYSTSKTTTYPMLASKNLTYQGWDFYLLQSSNGFGTSYGTTTSFVYRETTAGNTVPNGSWQYLCMKQEGNTSATMLLYHNGTAISSTAMHTGTRADDSSNNLYFGNEPDFANDFYGLIDEARLSKTVRTAAWIQTEYNNQSDPSSFFVVQAEEVGPGPVGYWSFDEGYGTTAHDESGQGNDGTVTGAAWQDESMCVSGKCLWFDGSDDFVDVGTLGNFGSSMNDSAKTYSLWFRTASSGSMIIMGTGETDGDSAINSIGISFNTFSTNDIAYISTDRYTNFFGFSAITENNDKWHNLVLIADIVEEENFLYFDGIRKEVDDVLLQSLTMEDFVYSLLIGALNNGGVPVGFFQGFIDEVKIYPYARTADQIKQDYNAGLSGVKSNSGVAVSFGGTSDMWLLDGDELVGYWKMDEAVGVWDSDGIYDDAIDSSGNGNTGSASGGADSVAGKFTNSGNFDGINDYLHLGTRPTLDVTTNFSFSAWVFWNGTGNSIIYASGNTNFQYYSIGINSNSGCSANYLEFVEDGGPCYPSATTFPASSWHHVTIVKNGDSGENLIFYIDGNKNGSASVGDVFADGTKRIGARIEVTDRFFNGMLDEVRIYNRALSPDEVMKLYEWAPGPVAHWKFDEKSGTSVFDSVASSSTSGGNEGTIYGATWAKGKYGSALDFDGTDKNVSFGTARLLDGAGAASVCFWLYYKPSSVTADGAVVSTYLNSQGYMAWVDNVAAISGRTNTMSFVIPTGTDYQIEGSNDLVRSRQWDYYCTTYQGGSFLRLYRNGILDMERTDSVPLNIIDNANTLEVGEQNNSRRLDAIVDEVRIYNYARTEKQIMEDMYGGAPAVNSPVLHLSFDEGFGGTANNTGLLGAANNGLLYPGTSGSNTSSSSMWSKTGQAGGSMEFDGTNDYVHCGAGSLGINDQISVSAWVYETNDNYGRIVSKHGSTDDFGWMLARYDDNDSFEWRISTNGSNWLGGRTSPNSYLSNQWYHVMATYDGVYMRVYIDGEEHVGGDFPYALTGSIFESTDPCRVGFQYLYYHQGLIDEVKVWNFALNADDVKSVYNDSKAAVMGDDQNRNSNGTAVSGQRKEYCIPGDTSVCTAPVIELNLDEKSGTTAFDTSGYGRNGTLNWMSTSTNGGWMRGKNGTGLQFDGIDDYVSLPAISALTDYSIELWYKPSERIYSGNTGKNSLYSLVDATDTDLYLYHSVSDNGELRFRCFEPTNDLLSTTADWAKDRWYHIAVTYTNTGTRKRIYVNGVLENSQIASCPFRGGDNQHWLGAGTYQTNAVLDGLKVFNYERTPAQIAWDYNRGAPVAYWKFDECEGGTIHDESGNGNHGTLNLGATGVTATGTCASSSNSFWSNGQQGKYKSSGSFDGTNDYIVIPDSVSQDFGGTMSISHWFKVNSDQTGKGMVMHDNSSYKYMTYVTASSSIISFYVNTASGLVNSGYNCGSANCLADGQWHHLVGTYDRTLGTRAKVYMDGVLVDQMPGYDADITAGDEGIYIGRWSSAYFGGLIDEVKIFNYALTMEQIENEYNGGAVRFGE